MDVRQQDSSVTSIGDMTLTTGRHADECFGFLCASTKQAKSLHSFMSQAAGWSQLVCADIEQQCASLQLQSNKCQADFDLTVCQH